MHPRKHASVHTHTQTHTHYLHAEQLRQHMSLNPIVFPYLQKRSWIFICSYFIYFIVFTYAHGLNTVYPCLLSGSHPLSAPDLAALVSPLIGGRAQGSTPLGCPLPRHSSACPYKDTAVYPVPFACSDADPQTPSGLDSPPPCPPREGRG